MDDFIKYNYHAHTVRCQHAYGTEREFIEAAIRMGIRRFCFSDHVPSPAAPGYVSGIRMRMDEAKEYHDEIKALADEYKDRIEIFVGFEMEYTPIYFKEQIKLIDSIGFDFLILGEHFWTTEEDGPWSGTPTDDAERIRAYVDTVIEAMETGRFLYVAHPDIMNYNGLDSVYEWEMTRLCKAAKEMHIPLEINMIGMKEKKQYPSKRFFQIAAEVGCDIIIGLDAHSIEHITDVETYKECVEFAKKLNLHLIDGSDLL